KNPEIKDNVNVNSSKPDMNYINQTLNQAEDKMKNALGNVIDIEDEPEEEEPEKNEPENSQPENNEPKEDEINIEGLEGHDINSMEIDEEIHYEEPKTKLQQAEDKVNSFLNDDSLEDEKKPEKTETVDDIQKKTDELASKVDEIVKEPLSNKEPEKKEPEAEKSDNGVPEPYSPEPDEKMLPKQQLNHLSDMIDSINERNGTAFSAKGTRKFLSNQFKAGKGETLAEQRETFKTSYTNFCKDAFENMMEKRARMPLKDRPSLEQSLADFQKYTKQLENLSKANGWMQKDVEMGPYGGLESSEIKKMQKAALDKEPKSTMDAVRNELVNAKDRTKALSEFSKNFKDQVAKVPAADKESSVQGPEASQAIAKLKALNDVHNNRTRGFRFAHPILYRREGKLLDSTQKALEAKGYDREVIAQMLKAPDTQDPVKEQYDKDAKSIDDIAKKTKKEIKSFEERKEKEDELVRKHVKGMRKQISVPEADNSKDLVNVPKEMKSPAVQKKLDIQKTNNLQVSGKGK
ncbi:MAG: hypothetical protein MJ068_01280, partial [Clostridia bacterium]|nr:hypothetical protein [Clostridia bacterium]